MRAFVLIAFALAGCAAFQASVVAPPVTSQDLVQARAQPPGPRRQIVINQGFDELRAQDQRLADIAFRLAAANAELCSDRRPLAGVTLHTLSQYSRRLAGELAGRFPRPLPGVLAVAAGSPADLAGLRPDDVLVAIDGSPFSASPVGDQPTYRDTQAADLLLTRALSTDRVSRLRIDRDGHEMELILTPIPGCAYAAQLTPAASGTLESLLLIPPASSAGRGSVLLSERMAGYTRDDDELAIVVSHEYAHNLLHHPPSVGAAGEGEADYVGIYLAARAGYDIEKAPRFWSDMTRDYPSEPFSHSRPQVRIAAIIAACREVEARRAAGLPLVPKFTGRPIRPAT